MSDEMRSYWNSQAEAFDTEPDHGLLDPGVRDAWRSLLLQHLPRAPADVVDLGSGTGTLAVLLAEQGYRVTGVDLAEQMVAAATAKAERAGVVATFEPGDASTPSYDAQSFDVVLSRHVLWALPDPSVALGNWVRLLRPSGRLVLVEGRWATGGGLTAAACEELVLQHRESVEIHHLAQARYWGRAVDDERYLAVSAR